jgi:hypothetical protein
LTVPYLGEAGIVWGAARRHLIQIKIGLSLSLCRAWPQFVLTETGIGCRLRAPD